MDKGKNVNLGGLQQAYLAPYPQPKEPIKLRITHEPWVSHAQYVVTEIVYCQAFERERFSTEEAAREYATTYLRGPRIVAEFTASEGEAPSTSPAGHP